MTTAQRLSAAVDWYYKQDNCVIAELTSGRFRPFYSPTQSPQDDIALESCDSYADAILAAYMEWGEK